MSREVLRAILKNDIQKFNQLMTQENTIKKNNQDTHFSSNKLDTHPNFCCLAN